MLNIISLQELRRTGFNKLAQMFNNEPEILIQERGRDRCVLIDIEHYNYLRGCELEVALVNARKEINEGKFTTGVGQHINHVETMLNTSKKAI